MTWKAWEASASRGDSRVNQRGWHMPQRWVFLCQPIGVLVGQMWRNSNLSFFLDYACDIHKSIILVAWFLPKKLNNYAQVELDRFLKDGDFSQNCLETTTTCDQSLPSLPAKSEDKSPTSSKQGGTLREINISHLGKRKIIFKYALSGGYVNSLEGNLLRIGNQLWVTFLTISSHLHEIYIETTSRFPLPPTVMKLENRTMEVDFCFEDDCFSTDSRLWTEEYLTLQLHPFAKSEDKFFQNGVITMGGS